MLDMAPMAESTTPRWDVEMDLRMTVLTMYMTTSTAEMMNGGLLSIGLLMFKDNPVGNSSSWNAFSTDRRKKNVAKVLYGSMSFPETFRLRLDLTRTSGRVSGASSDELGSCDRILELHIQNFQKSSFCTYPALPSEESRVDRPLLKHDGNLD